MDKPELIADGLKPKQAEHVLDGDRRVVLLAYIRVDSRIILWKNAFYS